MRRSVLALLLPAILGGCAGYASDYWRPKDSLIGRQLSRYGLSSDQQSCVGQRLTKNLSVWQLRQLADLAGRLQPSAAGTLGPRDFSYVAGLVQDPKVGPEVGLTLESCGAGTSVAAALAESAPAPVAGTTPAPPSPLRWIDLGVAETGQAIAIDIATVVTKGSRREGWFRLSDPGAATPSLVGYRLRVDCAARTITPTGARRYDTEGRIAQQEDYSEGWQTPLQIEAGTVMEIAWKRVCS